MTVQEVLMWMRTHRALLNLKGISGVIRFDYTMLIKAVDNKSDAYGYPVRFPERCLPRTIEMIRAIGTIPEAPAG